MGCVGAQAGQGGEAPPPTQVPAKLECYEKDWLSGSLSAKCCSWPHPYVCSQRRDLIEQRVLRQVAPARYCTLRLLPSLLRLLRLLLHLPPAWLLCPALRLLRLLQQRGCAGTRRPVCAALLLAGWGCALAALAPRRGCSRAALAAWGAAAGAFGRDVALHKLL